MLLKTCRNAIYLSGDNVVGSNVTSARGDSPPGCGGVFSLTSCISSAIVLCLFVGTNCLYSRDPGVVALEYRKYDDDDRRVQSSTSLPQHQVLRVRLSLDQI